MAGAGYKLFNTGDVLLASEVNTYLMQQTVMVFANASARTTALSGVLAEGMVSYLQDTNVVEIYNGSAWASLDDPNAIQNSIVDAKGDIITATADNVPARLAVGGTNGHVLTVDSSTSTGLKWAAAAPVFPAFSAYKSADQTITGATWTKISFQTERFDTDSCYDNATNYRFTPNKAGKYFVNAALRVNQTSAGNGWWGFYKNGSLDRYIEGGALDTFQWTAGGCMIDMNGSSDYVECYVYIQNGGTIQNGSSEYPTFEAFGARS